MGRKKKAGCVPVRRTPDGDWEVLLVQSRWTPVVWLFPKGGVEAGETGKAAATRETLEEGGVAGRLGPKLGVWSTGGNGNSNKPTTTDSTDSTAATTTIAGAGKQQQRQKMWLLFVDVEYGPDAKEWKERKKRRRAWHSLEDARAVITNISDADRRPELAEMLDAAARRLASVVEDTDGDLVVADPVADDDDEYGYDDDDDDDDNARADDRSNGEGAGVGADGKTGAKKKKKERNMD